MEVPQDVSEVEDIVVEAAQEGDSGNAVVVIENVSMDEIVFQDGGEVEEFVDVPMDLDLALPVIETTTSTGSTTPTSTPTSTAAPTPAINDEVSCSTSKKLTPFFAFTCLD